jgi:hypothetical protein
MPKTKPVSDGRTSLNAERYKTQISMRVNRFGAFFVNQCSHSQRGMPINCAPAALQIYLGRCRLRPIAAVLAKEYLSQLPDQRFRRIAVR